MDLYKFHSRCPIVREEDLQLCQIVSVAGGRQAVPFPVRIMYLRESEAQIVYTHGGKLLKNGPTCNDYYGYLTSVENAEEEAERLCNLFSIDKQSSLTLSIILTIKDKAVTGTTPPVIEYGRTEYTAINGNWMRYVPDKIEEWLHERSQDKRYEIGKPLMMEKETEVFKSEIWNSKCPESIQDIKTRLLDQGF